MAHYFCSQDHTISNASEYADLARQRNPNIDILYITKSKVEESKPFLEDRFATVGSYSGCSQMHCFKYYGSNIIHMSETSDSTRFTVVKAFIDTHFSTESESNPKQEESSCEAENESIHLEVGHWVVVDYNGDHFNGEITGIIGDDYKVNMMHRSGNYWKWPSKADEIFYKFQKIGKVIHHQLLLDHADNTLSKSNNYHGGKLFITTYKF